MPDATIKQVSQPPGVDELELIVFAADFCAPVRDLIVEGFTDVRLVNPRSNRELPVRLTDKGFEV